MRNIDVEKDKLSSVSIEKPAKSPENITDNQQCVPSDFMQAQSLFERHVLRVIETLSRDIKQMEKRVSSLAETVHGQAKEFSLCFESLRKCQKQTAEFAESIFNRHALWPAIRTIVKLADEINDLKSKTEQFKLEDASTSIQEFFKQELDLSASIAADQLACLDIERITPVKGEAIDTDWHRVCGCIEADNKDLHGKICDVVKPGIVHRKSAIEPAIVSVFRYLQESKEPKKQ